MQHHVNITRVSHSAYAVDYEGERRRRLRPPLLRIGMVKSPPFRTPSILRRSDFPAAIARQICN
jgi:hypothetical protein